MSPSDIADVTETSVATINLHRRAILRKAGLTNHHQTLPYLFQNPRVMLKGGRGAIGLHAASLVCQCAYCAAMRATS